MNRHWIIALVAGVAGLSAAAFAQTPFTYQGQLKQNGQPFSGSANMTFGLYDSATGEGFIGDEVHNSVSVSNGLFTVELGAANSWDELFNADLWVEVTVNGTTLSPRQRLTSAPRAIVSKSLSLPFDSTTNNYSSSPLLRIYNQGTGGAVHATTSNGSANALVGYNAATSGGASGVLGVSDSQGGYVVAGLHNGTSGSSTGGFFQSQSNVGFGVMGRCTATAAHPSSGSYAGVFQNVATSGFAIGVQGETSSANNGYGVRGISYSTSGFNVGVYGLCRSGAGYGAYFDNTAGGVALLANGLAQVKVLQILGGSDLSEGFDVCDDSVQPGMVVAIDPQNPGKLALATQAYDKRVAGVVSGAGGVNVGMIMGQDGSIANGKHPIALNGRVYCYADASGAGIEPGDLLTSSNTPGYAMKAEDRDLSQGAIIGKAMTSLHAGERGLVLVLVNLQ